MSSLKIYDQILHSQTTLHHKEKQHILPLFKKDKYFLPYQKLVSEGFCLPFQKYKISLPLFKKDAGYLITISISNIAVIYVHVINRLLTVCRLLPIKSLPSSILIKTRSSHKKTAKKRTSDHLLKSCSSIPHPGNECLLIFYY